MEAGTWKSEKVIFFPLAFTYMFLGLNRHMILCLEESVCCVCGINFFPINTRPYSNIKVKKGAES